ncbi:methylisocitrate lyase, partial [Trinickia caryophylli]
MKPASSQTTPGAAFRAAVAESQPLQVVGAITAYAARMAEAVGFKALYLSGGGVAANSLGMPDLGISTMDDVLVDARRITDA